MQRRSGFTLIELLVVIAIVAILAALLFPVLTEAKQRSLQAKCLNNMKQLWTAFAQYRSDSCDRMPSLTTAPNWCGSPGTRKAVDPSKGQLWNYTRNKSIYECPVDWKRQAGPGAPPQPQSQTTWWTLDFGLSYSMNKWMQSTMPFDVLVGIKGRKMLFMIHEARKTINDGYFGYSDSDDISHDNIDSCHYDGTTALYCDGHASYYSYEQLKLQKNHGDWAPPCMPNSK